VTSVVIPEMMANVEKVEVVVAHNERATKRRTALTPPPQVSRHVTRNRAPV